MVSVLLCKLIYIWERSSSLTTTRVFSRRSSARSSSIEHRLVQHVRPPGTLSHSQRSRIAYRHELVDLSCPGEQRDVFRQCLRRLGLVRPSLRGVQLREAVEAGRDVTVARRQRPLLG